MKCQVCTQDTILPFVCPHCGGQFCATHRLPENHACPKIEQARSQRQQQVMNDQNYASYNYSYVYGQDPNKRKRPILFSQKEVKHISIAAALVIGIGFSIGLYENFFGGLVFNWTFPMMAVFALVMVASFLTHEFAHKFVAQRNGLWAEFRLTTFGAILTFASVFLPFKMIAPGAMMIGGTLSKKRDILNISVAGPITNFIYAIAFLGLVFTVPMTIQWVLVFLFAAYINAFMAVFNLVPFGVLDGHKIFSVDKKTWALAFIPSAALTAYLYWLMFT